MSSEGPRPAAAWAVDRMDGRCLGTRPLAGCADLRCGETAGGSVGEALSALWFRVQCGGAVPAAACCGPARRTCVGGPEVLGSKPGTFSSLTR